MLDAKVVEAQCWALNFSHGDLDVCRASAQCKSWKAARRATERLPIFVFAGNFWLLAPNRRQLQAMVAKFVDLLYRA
eukprot:15430916-Alexandrium_andersonii.AAC.1